MIIERFRQRLPAAAARLPESVEPVLRDAEHRVADVQARGGRVPLLGAVFGNARLVAQALCLILDQSLSPGRRFVEWGSGLGGATCAAAALGFEALGIDIDPEMLAAGRNLAAAHGLGARFELRSYRPDWAVARALGEPCEAPDVAWASADIVHVYPWPAEARLVERLFLALAPDDALLLSTYGPAEVRIHRKSDLDGKGSYAARRSADRACARPRTSRSASRSEAVRCPVAPKSGDSRPS